MELISLKRGTEQNEKEVNSMRSEAQIRDRLAAIKSKIGSQGDVIEFTRGVSSQGSKSLRPLTADEKPRAKGRAEGWFDALAWVLEESAA